MSYETMWKQLARLDDHARGRNGVPRSAWADSPVGQGVWFSEAARRQRDRSADLAEGWCRLARMRRDAQEAGDDDAAFARTAVSDTTYGHLYRFILKEYWGMSVE